MADATAAAGTPPAVPFAIPSGTDVYDALMGDIEMDLVSANLPRLREMYADETPAEHELRMQRYAEAFERYDKAFNAWIAGFQLAVAAVRKETLQRAEQKNQEEENAALATIESQFS